MPRGSPDWGIAQYGAASNQFDQGDLFSAQTGLARLDNRGRPIFWETFKDGLSGWSPYALGGGPAVAPLPRINRLGYSAVVAECTPGGAGAGNESGLFKVIYTGARGTVGLECGIRIAPDFVSEASFAMIMYVQSGGLNYLGELDYKASLTKVEATINNGLGGLPVITVNQSVKGAISTANSYPLTQLKLVVNLDTPHYRRFTMGTDSVDCQSVPLQGAAAGLLSPNSVSLLIGARGGVASFSSIDLAYVCVTVDEP